MLRSAVPLPRDEATLKVVLRLKESLREIGASRQIGDYRKMKALAVAVRREADATGYQPLSAALLEVIGMAESELDGNFSAAERHLREALFTAESGSDDVLAATATIDLIFVSGYRRGNASDAEIWSGFTDAILDRLGPGHDLLRGWALNNLGTVLARQGDHRRAIQIFQRAVQFKEAALGSEHPDVAVTLHNEALSMNELGRFEEAEQLATRARAALSQQGDPGGTTLSSTETARADALFGLGRRAEARASYVTALRAYRENLPPRHPEVAYPLHGLGVLALAEGDIENAVGFLSEALSIRQAGEPDPVLAADTRFALARALWRLPARRGEAIALAKNAKQVFAAQDRTARAGAVAAWLAGAR
jgi:Flp pilus assembly protein TadD